MFPGFGQRATRKQQNMYKFLIPEMIFKDIICVFLKNTSKRNVVVIFATLDEIRVL